MAAHNSVVHHHHDDIVTIGHDNEAHAHDVDSHEQENRHDAPHNMFSYAQLDEDYLPAKFHKLTIELPVLYLPTRIVTITIHTAEQSKTLFGYYREFPPPLWLSSNHFSRPPPGC
jgi:hypothetical protein